jgi:uncharacterized membrane protein (DUF485 family)
MPNKVKQIIRHPWVAALFIIMGLALVIFPILANFAPQLLTSWLPWDVVIGLEYNEFGYMFVGAILALIGVLAIIPNT